MQITASPESLPETPAPQVGRWLVRFFTTPGVQEARIREVSPSGIYCRVDVPGPTGSPQAASWFQITDPLQAPPDGLTIQLVEWLGDSPCITRDYLGTCTGAVTRPGDSGGWSQTVINQAPPFHQPPQIYPYPASSRDLLTRTNWTPGSTITMGGFPTSLQLGPPSNWTSGQGTESTIPPSSRDLLTRTNWAPGSMITMGGFPTSLQLGPLSSWTSGQGTESTIPTQDH